MHPNEALARREMELIDAGDLESLYADDLVMPAGAGLVPI